MNQIEIPLSKFKILLAIGGSILFILTGLVILIFHADQENQFSQSILSGVGICSILFFMGSEKFLTRGSGLFWIIMESPIIQVV